MFWFAVSAVVELFGRSSSKREEAWTRIVETQECPFLGKRCYKVRKSEPETSIGSCTVLYGMVAEPILICPTRFIERRQIFTDCLHLLTTHEPGNELHIVSEVAVPGGHVDYFLASARGPKVRDFVGIEIQTLDTTGTVWPERQRLLKELGVPRKDHAENMSKSFGMNWKHTAKTILVQIHHKIKTFEHLNKKLVLVTQDRLMEYMARSFDFGHVKNPATIGDSMHLHSYRVAVQADDSYKLFLNLRQSTDADGVAVCLGLQAEAHVGLDEITQKLQTKIGPATLFSPA